MENKFKVYDYLRHIKEEDIDFNEHQLHKLNSYFPILLDITENTGIQNITNQFFFHFEKFNIINDDLTDVTLKLLEEFRQTKIP